MLVTSRPYGLNAAEVRRLGLRSVTIADLDRPLQELLVRRWFDALSPDAEQGAQKAAEMRAHLAERPEVSPLVASPMLLTALCVIFNQGKRLPRDKHELYDRILDNVLHNRYLDEQQEIPLVRNRLSVIAYGMHTGAGLDEDRETPQAEATTAEIERMIQRYRDESPATEPGFRGAVQACDDLLTRSGVLLPRPGKRAGFYHFTFQDFLAAQLILEREADLAAFFRRRAARQEWRSTLSFVFTSLMSRSMLPDKGIRLLESLIEPLTLDSLPLAVVVADCLEILAGRGVGLQAAAPRAVPPAVPGRDRARGADPAARRTGTGPGPTGRPADRRGPPRSRRSARVGRGAGGTVHGGRGRSLWRHRAAQEAEVQSPRTVPDVPLSRDQFAVPPIRRRWRLPASRSGGPTKAGSGASRRTSANRRSGGTANGTAPISRWWACRSGRRRRSPRGPAAGCPASWSGKPPHGARKRSSIRGETTGRTGSATPAN